MDISFNCGTCGQHLVIDGAGAGFIIRCPTCGQEVIVPTSTDSTPNTHVEPEPTKKERTVSLKWTPPSRSTRGGPKK